MANGSHDKVRLTGPSASSRTQQQRRPNSSQVPSTSSPPGARPARSVAQAYGGKLVLANTGTGAQVQLCLPMQ